MHVTMVKKRLGNGEPCRKCAQAEDFLKSRDLWNRIDEVVLALEDDPASPGMKLGAKFGVSIAPFFIVREDDGRETVYESAVKLAKERLSASKAIDGNSFDASRAEFDVERFAVELTDRAPDEILRAGLEHFGKDLAIAFSGAEDVVLLHMAAELGLPFSVFSLDTGRLHPETYRFIDAVRKRYGTDIDITAPDPALLEPFVRRKGLFSFYEDGHEECCEIRKIEPMRRRLAHARAWATGQRRDQSPATRSAIAVVEWDRTFSGANGRLVKFNPLAAWTSARTWQFIRDNGVPFNPLHEHGFVSIGCEPCSRAVLPGEHERAGRWWWEDATKRECGLHIGNTKPPK